MPPTLKIVLKTIFLQISLYLPKDAQGDIRATHGCPFDSSIYSGVMKQGKLGLGANVAPKQRRS